MAALGVLKEIWVYNPDGNYLLNIYEGDGSNLFEEDEDEGYVDYLVVDIWYDIDFRPTDADLDELAADGNFDDGIQSMLTANADELFHTPQEMADYIADAWGYSGDVVASNF